MQKIILIIFSCLALLPAVVLAAPDIGTDSMVKTVATGAGYDPATQLTLSQKIGSYIRVALSLTGVIFLVLTVYAGILWMTAAGNEDKVAEAKSIVTRASLGLLITLAAFSITAFVMAFTGASTGVGSSSGSGGAVGGSSGCTDGFWSCWAQGFKNAATNNPLGVSKP